ncbi:hypothetical protein B5F15_15085 [Butyricicoccus pullicaecorum]|uniref:Uncharacterized protein n=1 Tax=Butyricicoccus pullicaecorum TaxID=501571 RepID=A0A1Y4LEZ4_9FIRM|nr:hypothetical protein B5F15_15085 [Butyricicoccus pullicaecorum]
MNVQQDFFGTIVLEIVRRLFLIAWSVLLGHEAKRLELAMCQFGCSRCKKVPKDERLNGRWKLRNTSIYLIQDFQMVGIDGFGEILAVGLVSERVCVRTE